MQLNWSRSQYLLAFNAAILTVGTGLLKLDSRAGDFFTAGVFALGALTSIAAILVTTVQHDYYRKARNRARRIERRLGIDKLGLDSTPGMRDSQQRWLGKVTNLLYVLFAVTATFNLVGVVYCAVRASTDSPANTPSPASPRSPQTPAPPALSLPSGLAPPTRSSTISTR